MLGFYLFEVHARPLAAAGAAAEAVVRVSLGRVGGDGLQGRHLQLRLCPADRLPRGQPPLLAEPGRAVRGLRERNDPHGVAEVP